ncbi:HEAT repeat domain-containing protein [Agrococcus terreus]|uniref:HEAT repeat n=1 Tax=Agrococcus terreus TaxID=574649 RepID=A0ABQ2KMU8_9MICO|nr:HEAT repeat domain-containing protein [Agrococcus terreus]GGN87858.1 hypothetical protein GCM10010968_22810 [Agrococcus terreus]
MITPLPAEFLWVVLIASSALIVGSLAALLLQRTRRHARARRREALDAQLRPLVLEATVAEGDEIDDVLERVRALARVEREHIGRTAYQMLRDITGEAATNLRAVADAAGLVPRVVADTRSRDAVIRADAAEALGLLAPEGALERLRELARDPSPEVRTVAVRALGGFDDDAAVRSIVAALAADSGVPATVATTALLQQGWAAGDRVRLALEDEDPSVRRGAARVAGILQAPGSAERLVALVDDPLESVRIAAMRSLERVPSRDAVGPLVRAALEGGVLGEAAATTLLAMPGAWTREAIARIDHEAEPGVRRAAGLRRKEAAA